MLHSYNQLIFGHFQIKQFEKKVAVWGETETKGIISWEEQILVHRIPTRSDVEKWGTG